ncbi:DUF2461 domain-containing protein [Roseivirga sp. BDSF3-8]|uniref:DUF2461 domain-containing protein n=1 Tax=Roseivirga sp. BDSF3-8 TaxID=3241598 RepID=UPI003531FAA9
MNTALILDFLSELEKNNSKEWMDANREWYEEAREEFKKLVGYLLEEMASFDEGLRTVTPKESIFRINRDIRFSKDKRPYKNNFGAFMAEGGRKTPGAGYYLHMQAGNESFAGGGIYMPPSPLLAKIRQEVDYNAGELKRIVEEPEFRSTFGAIKGEKLKTAPKGYPKDHPNIDLLRLKSFVVTKGLSDEELRSQNIHEYLVGIFRTQRAFNDYLNVAIS